ncbi:MAG: hypothetical protein PHR83_03885 [Paludibacter sp.]|nr:hypothetical protein [Paludibacter sp.]
MDALFTKLNYKEGKTIYVLNQPEDFDSVLSTIPTEISVQKAVGSTDTVEFVLVFTTSKAEVETFSRQIAPALKGDAIFWLVYPKGTSKKYKCDFNRDTSWDLLAPFSLLPVRQVAIDDDWSALRFRKAEFIKNLTRK